MASIEEVKLTSTDLVTKSTETANNISIEHAYSEELATSHAPSEPIDSSSITSSLENAVVEAIVNSSEESARESIPEQKSEQIQEKVKSRELKSLLDAAKESNLDTNIVHKRESRKSVDPYIIKTSNENQESGGKRAMRSQNPEFVARHKKFLHKVSKSEISSDGVVQDNEMQSQKKDKDNASLPKTPKRKKENFADDAVGGSSVDDVKKSRKSLKVDVLNINMKKNKDGFCWRCHRDGILVQCESCPRAFHPRCLKQPVYNPERWPCPECLAILQAESTKTRSPAMREMSLEHLCELLKYAAKRMMNCAGSEPFIHPVDLKAFPDYRNYVVQPMDLTTIQNNIRNNVYGSTVAFMTDAKWILHNSIIYNSYQSKLTTAAKSIIKICKQEMSEIETCSECYQNANTKKNSWFVEVCSKPHILLWAKLKGFPYWPAKAMTTNAAGLVDVRFFGAHDRAWIPLKECFLYSKKDPNTTNKNKRNNIAECIKEVDIHIEKLNAKFGEFYYAPYRTPYDPNTELEQLAFMLPKYIPSPKIKANILPIKMDKIENGEEEKRFRKRSKSRSRSESREILSGKHSRSRASSVSDELRSESMTQSDFGDDGEVLTSSSKTSLISDDKSEKPGGNFSTDDFDKFMEGYGTEDDETLSISLNEEMRKKIKIHYDDSDSDDESSKLLNLSEIMKNGSDENNKEYDDGDKSPESISEMALTNRGKVRTRGGYHNVTGKLKVLGSRTSTEPTRKRSLASSPSLETPPKFLRRNSDISSKSDSSRVSGITDKINRVEEFSDTLEVSLANTSKDAATVSFSENTTPEKNIRPEFMSSLEKIDLGKLKPIIQVSTGDLYNKNKEFRISPQNKSISIAERLMKKITESELSNDMEKVESVKKQILNNLESNSSSKEDKNDNQNNDDVSSSDNKDDKEENKKEITEEEIENKENNSNSDINNEIADKTQNVSSSTEASSTNVEEPVNSEDINKITNTNVEKNAESNNDVTAETLEEGEIPNENIDDSEKKDTNEKLTNSSGKGDSPKEVNGKSSVLNENDQMDVDTDEDQTSGTEESEVEHSSQVSKKVGSHVKLVNVSDIISGKINEQPTQEPSSSSINKSKPPETESITESIDIKSEPMSDDEETRNEKPDSDKPRYDVTLTVVDKMKKPKIVISNEVNEKEKGSFKITDNMTRIIDSVASNYSKQFDYTEANKNQSLNLNKKEITLRPISKLIQSPKQKARKSFPNSPHKMTQIPTSMKKVMIDKKDIPANAIIKPASNLNMKVVTSFQNVSTQIVTTSTPTITTSKENMVYISQQTAPVLSNMTLLPPNQPITLTQSVGSPILTMVQHHISTPGLLIQHNPSIPTTSQISIPSTSQLPVVTPTPDPTSNTATTNVLPQSQSSTEQNSQTDERNVIPDSIAKAVGDLLCKPPPKLKPRPPGALCTQFDEGTPSSAGPATKLINSVAHRLSDYFRGLLRETLQDLSAIGSPESKIRTLELEIETLKQKHAEEMLELRKNISSILKDIQKSIVEEKAKIVDETRAICEAERLRCVEEAKSKQWCAYCLKEAQFYCCWNTSYCDYPCQQKHWATHMKTCSQTTIRSMPPVSNSSTSSSTEKTPMTAGNKQLTKHTYSANNKTVLKPTRMIVKQTNKQGVPMYVPVQRPLQGGQQTITLVESTPGNFEIVGNHGPISLGGKLVPTTTIKVKPGNLITVASSSSSSTSTTGSGTQKTIILSQKAPQMVNKSSSENKT